MIEDFSKELADEYAKNIADLLNIHKQDIGQDAFNQLTKSMAGKGKMFRSLLALLVFLGYSKQESLTESYRWAISFDILQSFILFHDDILDKATIRRGSPVPSKELALVWGDILFASGVKQFMSIPVNEEKKSLALMELMQIAIDTGIGEMADQRLAIGRIKDITEEEIAQVYMKKTAMYSFVSPFVCAAIIGGASSKDIELLRTAGSKIGVAYQYLDDLIDVFMKEGDSGKTSMNDVQNGKLNIVLFKSLACITEKKEQERFLSSLEIGDIKSVKSFIESISVKRDIISSINALVLEGIQCIDSLEIDLQYKKNIKNIISSLFEKYLIKFI